MKTRPTRALHVLDPENLIGLGQPTREQVERLRQDYLTAVPVGPHDLIVLAASGVNSGMAMGMAWPGARLRWMLGVDGADNCLLDVITEENVAERFTHLIVGSGDHAFTAAVKELADKEVHITVVTGLGQVSADLYRAAHSHIQLATAAAVAAA